MGIDILTIKSEYLGQKTKMDFSSMMSKVGPLRITNSDEIIRDLENIKFPVHLEPGQSLLCKIKISIRPDNLLTAAQIASRLQVLQSNTSNFAFIKVFVEAVGNSSISFTFDNVIKVIFRPLWDFYVNHWIKLCEDDLVRLAGGTYLPENEQTLETKIISENNNMQ